MTSPSLWPPGTLVGNERYRIEEEIGSGGAGMVFRATMLALHRPVALKVATTLAHDALEALREEAQLLFGLRHPGLPLVSDFFVEQGRPCLVMEFVEGQDLHALMVARGGPLAEPEALHLIAQIAEALAYLHTQTPPIVHRDVKPANIRVRPDGSAVLVDFGIAKVGGAGTQTHMKGRGLGTPPYAPPEQYAAGLTDTYTDVYALGATLYVLLTAELPLESVLRQSGQALIPPRQLNPALSGRTEQLLLKALALTSAERFPSARELLAALRSDQPISTTVAPTIKLNSEQTCPACGTLQTTAHPLFCIQCGATLALRFPKTGRILTQPADLVATCDADWDAALDHLRTQRLQSWLTTYAEQAWLTRLQAAQVRYPQDDDAALELLLRPQPLQNLHADQQCLDFGRQTPASRPTLGLHLRLATPGYLHGQVVVSDPWFTVTPTTLRIYPGQPIPPLLLAVKPEVLEGNDAERRFTGTLRLVTNRGTLELPVQLEVHNPPRPEVPTLISCGKVEARQRHEQRVILRNVGGGIYSGQVSARQPWLLVESQQARFALHRGEQHTVTFSLEPHRLSPAGMHEGSLLWESEQGNLLTRVQVEVSPPFEVTPGDAATALNRPEDLIRLCDCLHGGEPHAWERGVGWLQAGKLASALRFFQKDGLAREAEQYAQQSNPNIGLELLLRQLGAKPARHFRDNQRQVISQITGPLSRKPAVVEYALLNTSKRGYLHGYVRPLVAWLSIAEPHFGCLPDQEAVITLQPDYAQRTRMPLFGGIELFEIVLA
jgi:hypothetical protein